MTRLSALGYSADMSKKKLNPTIHKTFVDIERVRPLVVFLRKTYGGVEHVAEVTGIPYGTLNTILYDKRRKSVKPELAKQIADAVMAHRRAHDPWATHENDGVPRYATLDEKSLPKDFNRWRPAGRARTWNK